MPFKTSLSATAVALCLCAPAYADIFTTTGTTTGGPTFNRPQEDLSALSGLGGPFGVGTNVNYNTFSFTVSEGGAYSFLTTATFDSFAVLYQGAFNPASPLTNAVVANDDVVNHRTSGFAFELNAGTSYHYVMTAYENGDAGAFSTTIGGPGSIVPVPEPAAYAMLMVGLCGIGLARRCARQQATA